MVQDAAGVTIPEDRWGRWLLWASLATVFVGLFSALGDRIPWPIGYSLVSSVVLLLALTTPRKYRVLAVGLGLIFVLGFWLAAFVEIAIGRLEFLQEAEFIRKNAVTLASAVGAFVSITAVAGVIVSGLYFASEFVLSFRAPFGLTRSGALRALATVGFGLQYPYMIVENGEVTITKPKGLLDMVGGPGLTIVRPGNAILFERVGKVTQIAGPGTTQTRLFEFPKQVLQLRPRWLTFGADDVLTQDGIALRLKGGMSACIEPAPVTEARIAAAGGPTRYEWTSTFRDIIGGDFPVYQDSVFRAVYLPAGSTWEANMAGSAVAMIRDAVGQLRLEDIFGDPTTGIEPGTARIIGPIEQAARDRLRGFSAGWGVEVRLVEISSLKPPPEIEQRVLKRWAIATERINIEQLGEAEAETLKVIEATKKNSFEEMSRSLQTTIQRLTRSVGEEQTLRFQDVLQTIVANAGRDSTTTLRYIETLEKLSKHPGARIVIAPGGQGINIEEHE